MYKTIVSRQCIIPCTYWNVPSNTCPLISGAFVRLLDLECVILDCRSVITGLVHWLIWHSSVRGYWEGYPWMWVAPTNRLIAWIEYKRKESQLLLASCLLARTVGPLSCSSAMLPCLGVTWLFIETSIYCELK